MGVAKRLWMEAQERGWSAPEKHVCAQCVNDEYLEKLVSENVVERQCDYCHSTTRAASAAPLEIILEPIADALFAHFADPSSAGLPRDSGEWVGEESITDTQDALLSLGLEVEEALFDDIAGSFDNDAWFPCADGHWLELHEHEELDYAWSAFVRHVKHRSRYFFTRNPYETSSSPGERYGPDALLKRIGNLVEILGLVAHLPAGTTLHRVRRVAEGGQLQTFEEMGPPPEDRVAAGRMNPPGISYFYLAMQPETALAEVLHAPPCYAAIGEFSTKSELLLLDLTRSPPQPSIFDSSRREEREGLIFLDHFVEAISAPVGKDGREHLEYVPSQVVCEFFAQVFRTKKGKQLDGIVYRSAVRPAGRNTVLFPLREINREWDDLLTLRSISHGSFHTWEDFKKAL